MKTYRISRFYRWSRLGAKVVLTGAAGVLYYAAVTHPTPLSLRLWLLAGIALFGWLFYVRLPRVPTKITVTEDGWVNFESRRGTLSVPVAEIRSIGRTYSRRNLAREIRRRSGAGAQSFCQAGRLSFDRQRLEPIDRDGRILVRVSGERPVLR